MREIQDFPESEHRLQAASSGNTHVLCMWIKRNEKLEMTCDDDDDDDDDDNHLHHQTSSRQSDISIFEEYGAVV
jgi:hypothetical protein